jgi:ribonucleoside-diphosphate reductase alpha chain
LTDDKEIRTATSIVDYIFKRLAHSYLSFDDRLELGLASIDDMPDQQISLLTPAEPLAPPVAELKATPEPEFKAQATEVEKPKAHRNDDTAPMCYNCGNQTQKAGSCYVCTACGSTTGCS